ncbi:hypothetical protein QNH46_02635 [Paenibacillus woosongensis]|uniref:Uncharacterized protein n=1 Tax=Paenibacillus woosongensis TaxID=307580 RepID=A0AA95L2F7_9BACL|nr:hypothetical protein [Paenibacillus woosongensis]WHX49602.1 hypothetical protein QNH46_02635 [Paenibacillus woosongensis]
MLWSNTYLIGTWAAFRDVVALPDGSVIVAGRMSSSEISGSLAVNAKINRVGELVWVKRNESDQIHSMIPSRDGNMILTRYIKDENRYYLQTMNSAGTVLSDLRRFHPLSQFGLDIEKCTRSAQCILEFYR